MHNRGKVRSGAWTIAALLCAAAAVAATVAIKTRLENEMYAGHELRYVGFVDQYYLPYYYQSNHAWPRDLTGVDSYAVECSRLASDPAAGTDLKGVMALGALGADKRIQAILSIERWSPRELVWSITFREPNGHVAVGPAFDTRVTMVHGVARVSDL